MSSAKQLVVEIRNYQRIKKAKFVFEEGLNVIVGSSNMGKSATLRAITSAIFNLSKDSHITVGEKVSVVGLRYNGHDVIWKRDLSSASKNSYKIDGKTFTKIGKGQPKEVAEALGIYEVDLDDVKERLNFQKQMAYPFLLDRTPSQVFKFMAQSAEEDNIMSIIDKMKTDQNSISTTIKANQAAMDSIKVAFVREKEIYDRIKDKYKVCNKILDLDSFVKKVSSLGDSLKSIKDLINICSDSKKSLDSIGKIYPVVEESVSKSKPLVDMLELLAYLTKELILKEEVSALALSTSKISSKKLKSFEGFPSNEVFTVLGNIWALYSKGSDLNSELKKYKSLIESTSESISNNDRKISSLVSIINEVDDLSIKIDNLNKLILLGNDCVNRISKYSDDVDRLKNEISQIESKLLEFDVCPYCGSSLKEDLNG